MSPRTAVSLLCMGAIGIGVPSLTGTALAAPTRAGCVIGGYSTTASKCVTVPASGAFSIKVPHTRSTLVGKGTSATAGTKIHVVAVANPSQTSGTAIRVTANGPVPPLHARPGKLYRYDPKTGKSAAVKEVTRPGIYIVKP